MSTIIDLRDFCQRERDWLLATIETLVRLESPTPDKAAVDRCGAELAARIGAIGGWVTRLPRTERGDHLRAEFGVGPAKAGPHDPSAGPHDPSARPHDQILLLGH